MMIAKMNTIHPNASAQSALRGTLRVPCLNLRCGNMAGVEEVDNVLTQGNVCTTLVEFDDISEECEATADAWSSIGEMLQDVGEDVDDVCKTWLKRVHPDATSDTFTAAEVAEIVDNIRVKNTKSSACYCVNM